MPDPIALVPLPQSVLWSSGAWVTEDPWGGLSVGVSADLASAEYALSVSPEGASLTAGSEAALADGRNTFAQIVAGTDGSIPCVTISDRPAHAWRGMHLDVARHFLPVEEIEKLIDAMALHRLNILHLHLTDDQGWRMEVRGYPLLTEVGGWRDRTMVGHMASNDQQEFTFDEVRHGGSYTQQELRDLVTHAERRGVTIVPEVDLPGHMQAAVAAYPALGTVPGRQLRVREVWGISDHVLGVSDAAFSFVRDVLTQVAEIFPSPWVHIGGDECPTVEWERSAEARERLQEWGLTRISEIQGRFTAFAAEVLAEHGRRTIAWDEVLETHVPDGTVIMNWRTEDGVREATSRGFGTVVATAARTYLDAYQGDPSTEPLAIGGMLTLRDVYENGPLPADLDEEGRALVLGVQAQLWTEYMPDASHVQYMAFPRLCAFAEHAWGSPRQDWPDFEARLRAHLPRLDAFGLRYRPLDG